MGLEYVPILIYHTSKPVMYVNTPGAFGLMGGGLKHTPGSGLKTPNKMKRTKDKQIPG